MDKNEEQETSFLYLAAKMKRKSPRCKYKKLTNDSYSLTFR